MKGIHWKAVYVLWLRDIKRLLRSKSRIIGSLMSPMLFLVFLGLGFSGLSIPGAFSGVSYIHFLIPGIIGMGLLFSSTFAGLSLLMDREYGFLKEIMVAPVNRVSIVLGRIAGGMSTGLFQGIMLLAISMLLQPRGIGALQLLGMVGFMMLISVGFIGLGLAFASLMRDTAGFQLIVNFVIFPFFFLSGALYPLSNLPPYIRWLSYIDPLTYGVDGMRGAFINSSLFPIWLDALVLLVFGAVTVGIAAWLFERSESV